MLGIVGVISLVNVSMNNTNANNDLVNFIDKNPRMLKDTWLDYSSNKSIVDYLYKNKMTIFNDVEKFRPNDNIIRAEVVKFFVNFAKAKGFVTSSNNNCNFTDLNGVDSTLTPYIKEACQMGLFNGSKWKFNPYGKLTYWEAIAVTMRMIEGRKLPEGWSHWALSSFEKAKEYMMILNQLKWVSSSNTSALNNPISRVDMWRLLEGADFYILQLQPSLKNFLNNL